MSIIIKVMDEAETKYAAALIEGNETSRVLSAIVKQLIKTMKEQEAK